MSMSPTSRMGIMVWLPLNGCLSVADEVVVAELEMVVAEEAAIGREG